MEWHDEGIILHSQLLGERKTVMSLFTKEHGRHLGVFGQTKTTKAWIHSGAHVTARWKARLETQLGSWTLEPLSSSAVFLLESAGPLAALVSAATLCHLALPERHPYPSLYGKFKGLLQDMTLSHWLVAYVFFELALLEELGYGLNLKACAVTGAQKDLTAVSPRTGRAVCATVAQPYEDRLLPLPAFLVHGEVPEFPGQQDILKALHLTGYFLERQLLGRDLPPARARLVSHVAAQK